jgi:NAD(P)-dependent dehydrogenase (short-subunit alcohol dehydrogenase family)
MGDVAIVSGAAGALGAEVARTLASRGWAVALVDTQAHADRLKTLAQSLPQSTWTAGDAGEADTWKRALADAERVLGAPPSRAALVAGSWRGGKSLHEETTDDTWTALQAANVESAYRGLRALLPGMVARRQGSIVVIGSRAVERPWTSGGSSEYAATKSAVVALARSAAAEVLGFGVRVNAVLPSTLDTPANRAAMPSADPSRWVSLASAAGVIAFLLSDDARDVSGAEIPVYGRA